MKNGMYIFQSEFASFVILDHGLDLKQCYLLYSTNNALTLSVLILCIEPLIPQLEPYKWIRASICVSKYWHDCNFLSQRLRAHWITFATVNEWQSYLQKWLCNAWFHELDFPEENENIFFFPNFASIWRKKSSFSVTWNWDKVTFLQKKLTFSKWKSP